MRERILIIFIAVAIGLLITTLIFFLYQQTKTIPRSTSNNTQSAGNGEAAPTNANSYLRVDEPIEGLISDKRLIEVRGTTHPGDTLVISTNQEDVAAKPSSDSKFSLTVTIDAGANVVIIRSIAPNGEDVKESRIVTFSTEEF